MAARRAKQKFSVALAPLDQIGSGLPTHFCRSAGTMAKLDTFYFTTSSSRAHMCDRKVLIMADACAISPAGLSDHSVLVFCVAPNVQTPKSTASFKKHVCDSKSDAAVRLQCTKRKWRIGKLWNSRSAFCVRSISLGPLLRNPEMRSLSATNAPYVLNVRGDWNIESRMV